jgi:uncharacterized protein (DUF58 family)
MKPAQCRPSRSAVGVAAAFLVTALALELGILATGSEPSAAESLRQTWLAVAIAALIAFALDRRSVRLLALPRVRRELPASLALHDWTTVALHVEPDEASPSRFQLHDHPPPSAETEGLPLEFESASSEPLRGEYRLRALRRGEAHFGECELRGRSRWGLWSFTAACGETQTVRVFPNFSAVSRYGLIAQDHHTEQIGIRLRRRRGEGLEFHQLREYRQGDVPRQIDWKATSRKQELISREYQDERDQRILFLLDCSRRMRAKDGELSHFDHSLNAMVLMSHVALRAGDAVGLMSFGEQPRSLPARKGIATVKSLLSAVYDLEPTTASADFTGAAEGLYRSHSRRSLVVLLTNIRTEDVDDLLPALGLLRRRHVVLVANLKERRLGEVMGETIRDFRGALRYITTSEYEARRLRVHDRLRRSGAWVLDSTPAQLPSRLINTYYTIKRSGVL